MKFLPKGFLAPLVRCYAAASLLAVSVLLGSSAEAQDSAESDAKDQWYCFATAAGAHDSNVDVALWVLADGAIIGSYASWTPEVTRVERPSKPYLERPALYFSFLDPKPGSLSLSSFTVVGTAHALGPRPALSGMRLSLTLDGSEPQIVPIPEEGSAPDFLIGNDYSIIRFVIFNESASNGWGNRPPLGKSATISLIDQQGRAVAAASYGLDAVKERDDLFARAWTKAKMLSRHLDRCEKATGGQPPDELLPSVR